MKKTIVQLLISLLLITSTWQNVALAASLPVVKSDHSMVIINSINNTDSATTTYRYNDLDQLTSVQNPHHWSSREQTYSQDGDLITAADGKEYTFNGQDQLVQVKLKSGKTINYQYYPNGLRSDRIIKNGEHIRFYYDQSGHVLATENVTATEKIKHSFFLSGVGKDMSTVAEYNTHNNQDSYYVHQNGDTVMMLARSVGNGVLKSGGLEVMGNQHYDAYGNPKALGDSYLAKAFKFAHLGNSNQDDNSNKNSLNTNAANNFTYKGEYQDVDSNIVYLKARDYDPASARFLSRDSYDVWNHYSYADSDPVNKVDPSGHNTIVYSGLDLGVNIAGIILGVLGTIFSGGSNLVAMSAFMGAAASTTGFVGFFVKNKTFHKVSSFIGYFAMLIDMMALSKGLYEGLKAYDLFNMGLRDKVKENMRTFRINVDEDIYIINHRKAINLSRKKAFIKGMIKGRLAGETEGFKVLKKKLVESLDVENGGSITLKTTDLDYITLDKFKKDTLVYGHKSGESYHVTTDKE
ncbi:RHS repeat domain-containing protein [Cysteiniphilum marinum]|nr:RHS repeat-associated core domain-containing protein [Cysteiniphilum marinum]